MLKRRDRERKLRPDLDYSSMAGSLDSQIETDSLGIEDLEEEDVKTEKIGKFNPQQAKIEVGRSRGVSRNSKNDEKANRNEKAKEDQNNENSFFAPENPTSNVTGIPDNSIPMVTYKHLALTFFNEYNKSIGLIEVSTNLRFLGFTGEYEKEQDLPRPLGYRYGLKVGFPIFKDEYKFPIYKAGEAQVYKKKMFGFLDTYLGVHVSPIFSVNVPHHGGGLQVFENNMVWAKVGLGLHFYAYNRPYELRLEYLKSTFMFGNYLDNLSGHTYAAHMTIGLPYNLSLNLSTSMSELNGDLKIEATHYQFSVGYHF